MNDQINSETFTTTLFALLTETFEEVQGIYLDKGTTLFETLATINAVEASQPVGDKCATLAAQVAHITFYLDVLEQYMLFDKIDPVDWGEVWRTVTAVTPQEWQDLQTNLQQSYARVLATMQSFDSWDNQRRLGGALGIVVHTAYHLGEIRQALCVLKEN